MLTHNERTETRDAAKYPLNNEVTSHHKVEEVAIILMLGNLFVEVMPKPDALILHLGKQTPVPLIHSVL